HRPSGCTTFSRAGDVAEFLLASRVPQKGALMTPRMLVIRLVMLGLGLARFAAAQETRPDQTFLEIELLMPQIGADPLAAQRWREVFEQLGEPVRIRQPLGSDRPSLKESQRGSLRTVKLMGRIERNGDLVLPGRTYTTRDSAPLGQWLTEL